MKAQDFVDRLKNCAPPIADLVLIGLSYEEAERFVRQYNFHAISGLVKYPNPILDLVDRFDASDVEVVGIRFALKLIEQDRYWQVGSDEDDPVVVDKQTGEVYVIGMSTHIYCAVDGASFLDALLLVVCHVSKFTHDERAYKNDAEKRQVSEQCAELAGGDKYSFYYRNILGCD